MAEDMGERTEDPTPKRKQESREQGQVAKSSDLAAVSLLFIGTVGIALAASWMLGEGATVMRKALGDGSLGDPTDVSSVVTDTTWLALHAARIAAPLLLIAWFAAILGQFMQVGWLFTLHPLQPSLSKLNPLNGFKKIFGMSGLVKVLLDLAKVGLILGIVVVTFRQHAAKILLLATLPLLSALEGIGHLLLDLALRILAALLIIGILDMAWQKHRHHEEMKMTKQQVKDEMKQSDGDPETKRRRMRMQQQIAMQRIGGAVPQADVIVTNPEHFAIAIKYDEATMRAPQVIAKGADYVALRIRQLAARHGVPIVERPPLARALWRDVPTGQEIPPDFYAAVAEVLAYVYRLAGKATR